MRSAASDDGWFTNAAIERIAHCVSSTDGARATSSLAIVSEYRQSEVLHGLADSDFMDPNYDELIGIHRVEGIRFYRFAGALDLAVKAGYVDLGLWKERSPFLEALKQFEANEAASEASTDLTLVRDLIDRVERGQLRVAALDDHAFYAFSAYLHLDSALHSDKGAQEFITQSAQEATPATDLSFLISPRHFAEALATGRIAGLQVPLAAGLSTLRYFRWLADVLSTLSHDAELSDAIIRHARWSHHAQKLEWRLNIWTSRMLEWESMRDSAREQIPYAWDWLRPNISDIIRLELQNRVGLGPPAPLQVEVVPSLSLAQLVAEGRLEPARATARKELEDVETRLKQSSGVDWNREAGALVAAGAELVKLGEVDAAAVVLVRFVDEFVAKLGMEDWTTEHALKILASARNPSVVTASSPASVNLISEELQTGPVATTHPSDVGFTLRGYHIDE